LKGHLGSWRQLVDTMKHLYVAEFNPRLKAMFIYFLRTPATAATALIPRDSNVLICGRLSLKHDQLVRVRLRKVYDPPSWSPIYPSWLSGCGHAVFLDALCDLENPTCSPWTSSTSWWAAGSTPTPTPPPRVSCVWFGRSLVGAVLTHMVRAVVFGIPPFPPVVEAFDRHVCAHPPTASPSITPINLTPPPPTPTLPCLPGGGAACGWRTSL
jgi:hypothetical protein